jgi:hypothetical protein
MRRTEALQGVRMTVFFEPSQPEEVERLYRERHQGFTVKHFHEHLVKDHGFGSWLHLAQAASAMGGGRAEGAAQGGRIGGSASGGLCGA